jgi:hypothetical protein
MSYDARTNEYALGCAPGRRPRRRPSPDTPRRLQPRPGGAISAWVCAGALAPFGRKEKGANCTQIHSRDHPGPTRLRRLTNGPANPPACADSQSCLRTLPSHRSARRHGWECTQAREELPDMSTGERLQAPTETILRRADPRDPHPPEPFPRLDARRPPGGRPPPAPRPGAKPPTTRQPPVTAVQPPTE